jgi:hypothetical protein
VNPLPEEPTPTVNPADNPENFETSEKPSAESAAEGSGAAALLAFTHIGLTGVIGFGLVQVLWNAHPNLVLSPLLVWQFLLPVCLGFTLFLPTDPLTRTLATVARYAGVAGLIAGLAAFIISMIVASSATNLAENLPVGVLPSAVVFFAHFSAAWLASVCLGEAIRCHLRGYRMRSWTEYLGGIRATTTLPLLCALILLHLLLDGEAGRKPLGSVLLVLASIPACRLAAYASVRRASRRPGADASLYSPVMAAAALAIILLTQQALAHTPVLSAILVGFGVWSLMPYLAGSRISRTAT